MSDADSARDSGTRVVADVDDREDSLIPGYRPHWIRRADTAVTRHGPALAALLGRRLTRCTTMRFVADDRDYPHTPVLLGFGEDQLEIGWECSAALAITWNSVDPAVVPRCDRARWVHDRYEPSQDPRGQYLWAVDLLEWPPNEGEVEGIGLAFSRTYLTVFAHCCLTLARFGPPPSRYRPRRIASMPPTAELARLRHRPAAARAPGSLVAAPPRPRATSTPAP